MNSVASIIDKNSYSMYLDTQFWTLSFYLLGFQKKFDKAYFLVYFLCELTNFCCFFVTPKPRNDASQSLFN